MTDREPGIPKAMAYDLVILFETLSPTLLGCYGGPWRTPAFDRLASAGTIFDAAFADGDLDRPFSVDPDDQLLELSGLPSPIPAESLVDQAEIVERVDPGSWHDLLSWWHADGWERPIESPAELADDVERLAWLHEAALGRQNAPDPVAIAASEVLQTLASVIVLGLDEQLCQLWQQLPPESTSILLTARAGWSAETRDPLSDVTRHVPAIATGGPIERVASLTTPERLLGEHPPGDEILFVGDRGHALRSHDSLYQASSDAYGNREERLFVKPADRFNHHDRSRDLVDLADLARETLRHRLAASEAGDDRTALP